jgi:hypothetical protein
MVTDPLAGALHAGNDTLTNVKVVVAVNTCVMVAVPDPSKIIVWFGPPLTVYVTVAFGVPANVTVAESPLQITLWFTEIAAAGTGKTVMTTLPVTGALHPPEAALTSAIVVVAV